MSWVPQTPNTSDVGYVKETYTLPDFADAVGREYSSVIDMFRPNLKNANRYIMVGVKPSAVTGTNLDIALYGSWTRSGTKVLLVDAIIADITTVNPGVWVFGQVDLNAYPFPYYFIAWTADLDESANEIEVLVAG